MEKKYHPSMVSQIFRLAGSSPVQAGRIVMNLPLMVMTLVLPSPLSFIACGVIAIDTVYRMGLLGYRLYDRFERAPAPKGRAEGMVLEHRQ